MFPTRLYGALPRVFAAALLFFAMLLLAFAAHANAPRHVRSAPHWHHRAARYERRRLARRADQSAAPALAAEITVFGRKISIGAIAQNETRANLSAASAATLLDGPSLDAGPQFPRVAEIVRAKAEVLGVPVGLALAITRYESGGRCDMHGRAGERGAMQILPQTARSVGVAGDLYDCATGIEAGLRYLKLAVAMHADAGWCAVASAYNSGTWHGSRCTAYGRAIALAAGLR
jgi:soluble lytic murein transglycosylase-like protein